MWDCLSCHIGLDSPKNPTRPTFEYLTRTCRCSEMAYIVSTRLPILLVGTSEWKLLGYKLDIPDHATTHDVSLATRLLGIV